jgi:hypothetical protein
LRFTSGPFSVSQRRRILNLIPGCGSCVQGAKCWHMRWLRLLVLLSCAIALLLPPSVSRASNPAAQPVLIIVVGAAGEEEFGQRFEEWAVKWEQAAVKGGVRVKKIGSTSTGGPDDESKDRDDLKSALAAEPASGPADLWLVLIGHGTFDGKMAKFNLRGTDVSAEELADWLKPLTRPVAVVNTSSASAPFVKALSAPGRIVVTATRSGDEQNFAHFGGYISESIADSKADLDKDGQVSLLEAFLMAARRTAEFYEVEGRLATEHALIDDNGDGLGTPADFFRGIRAVKKPEQGAAVDGLRAHQLHLVKSPSEAEMPAELRAKRDALELQIEKLRDQKEKLGEAEYYDKLEKLLLELGRVYQAGDASATPR